MIIYSYKKMKVNFYVQKTEQDDKEERVVIEIQ